MTLLVCPGELLFCIAVWPFFWGGGGVGGGGGGAETVNCPFGFLLVVF